MSQVRGPRRHAAIAALLLSLPQCLAAADLQHVGLTQSGLRIEASVVRGSESAPTVLLIGGLAGRDASSATVMQARICRAWRSRRIRLGQTSDVEWLALPWADGSRDPLARPNSLALAGHLVFAELAQRTRSDLYLAALRRAADTGFTDAGEMKDSLPYHDEMSDSLFMATGILAKAGTLTGERRYFDMAARHIAFMQTLVFRPDGLYRHSPLTDAAWGRGNAFPALGLAMTLADFPADHPGFAPILETFRRHMRALERFQDPDGLWREVIDHPGAYPEFSATAMIGTAMSLGIRNGWLDAKTY